MLEQTEIVQTSNAAWSGAAKLVPQGSQPYSIFDLTTTMLVEDIYFRVKSYFTNSANSYNVLYSVNVQIHIICGNAYSIVNQVAPPNPQKLTHGTTSGFILPSYITLFFETPCPVNNWEVSSSYVSLVAASGLPSAPTLSGGNRIVYPSNPNLHLKYVFYLKVTASGGSYMFWGPYTLDIGCTSTSFTYADATGLTNTGVAKWVGDPVASVYTFISPTFTLAYCPPISN